MANTYTHRIVSLKKSNGIYLNIVNSFVAEVTISDGTNSTSAEYKIETEELSSENDQSFIEYQNLTEANLISWLTSNEIEYEYIKKDLNKKLMESLQSDVESNFPWL